MNYITRFIEKSIEKRLFKGKLIIVYGARQVGKTTMVKKILEKYKNNSNYLNCEFLSVQKGLSEPEAEKIKGFLGDYKLIVLDEAQNIPGIGKVLKIMVDTYPKMQIIATGSSSFDLAQKVSEAMTGRTFTFMLNPLSLGEIKQASDLFTIEAGLENFMRFGAYPEVFSLGETDSIQRLDEITSKYLYKDILSFEGIKKSVIIRDLLELLALQMGNEVSYNELAGKLGIDRMTVQKYIDILEQSFVLFRLRAFSRNKRKEISKSIKIYFYDLGVRNSIIQNYNRLNLRNDVGALWENFCIVERMKKNSFDQRPANYYFWRTYTQKEIDLIEERGGKLLAYEFKWSNKKTKIPQEFLDNYSNAQFKIINRENYWEFII
jgi:predicted AAA+ superfamily ATPase